MTDGETEARGIADIRFSGGRYDKIGFPLDGIDDLHKYQRLVIEAAKKIWYDKHPKAHRLPSNFNETVRLRLTVVEKGSVVPVLEREPDVQQRIKDIPDLLDLSIAYVDDAFATIVSKVELPDDMPESMTSIVKLFGGYWQENERAVFRSSSAEPVTYTFARRKELLAALAAENQEVRGTLIGKIRMLDSTKEFIFLDGKERPINGHFSEGSIFDELHEVHKLSESADLIWLECKFIANALSGEVSKIEDVYDAGQFALSSNPWAPRLAELAAYPKGWLDGEGDRVDIVPISAALAVLDLITERGYGTPSIFADVEGGVRMEWLTDVSHTVLSVDNDSLFTTYHLNLETGEEDYVEKIKVYRDALKAVSRYIHG